MSATDIKLEPGALGQPPDDDAKEQPGDQRLWSVTTIIGVLEKPALLYWSAEQAAAAAVSIAGSLPQRIAEDGEAEVIKWLRDARFRKPRGTLTATALGTCAHHACEQYALTGVRPGPDELAALVRREGGARFSGVKTEVAVLDVAAGDAARVGGGVAREVEQPRADLGF